MVESKKIAEGVEFIPAGANFEDVLDQHAHFDKLLGNGFDVDSYLREFFFRCKHSIPVGAYRVTDGEVTDSWGFISRSSCKEVLVRYPGMGWSQVHVDMTTKGATVQRVLAGQLAPKLIPGRGVVLSFPGAFTYGHALVDISQRIQLAKVMGLTTDISILVHGKMPTWFEPFLAIAGLSASDCIQVNNGECYRVEELYIPTLTGINGVLNKSVATYSFRRMKETMNTLLGKANKREEIVFPLHTTMSSVNHPRGVVDREKIVSLLRDRYNADVFDPLTLSFAQQVDKFRRAKLVIGEDSSALHNILWSEGADLLVLAPPDRENYYHVGIQAVNGGQCAILAGKIDNKVGGKFYVNTDDMCAMVEKVLSNH